MKTKIVSIPGSKSFTNRALIMAALSSGKSIIRNISESDDSRIMIKCLKQLGIKIKLNKTTAIVYGNGGKFKKFLGTLNIQQAGTVMRFLTSLCTLVSGEIILDGSERMRKRPIGDLVDALQKLGASIKYLAKTGCPPLRISGGKIIGGTVVINGHISSQYITSLLLIGPVLKKKIKIKIIGKQISKSYIDMTIDGLKQFGVMVKNNNYETYSIDLKQEYKASKYSVEADASGASYLWGIAAVTGSSIKVKNINPLSVQGDIRFVDILQKMGCQVKKNKEESWIEVKGPKQLKPVMVDMSLMPDTAQTLAVVAAFVHGKTTITGLSTLKIKETDRLQTLHNELKKMGIKTKITNDSITVFGGEPHKAMIDTYNDHRMAMAFAVAGKKIPCLSISNPEVVKKSFPEFWEKIKNL